LQKLPLLLQLLWPAEFVTPMIALVETDHVGGPEPLVDLYDERQRGMRRGGFDRGFGGQWNACSFST
jgi:hypothetical protein